MSRMDDKEGGPAFPEGLDLSGGMTLRDWFAGQALAGQEIQYFEFSPEIVAAGAYALADAMLAEREKVK